MTTIVEESNRELVRRRPAVLVSAGRGVLSVAPLIWAWLSFAWRARA